MDPKEILANQVYRGLLDQKVYQEPLVTLDRLDKMDALEFLDPQGLRVNLVSQGFLVVLDLQVQKAIWETWEFQDLQG